MSTENTTVKTDLKMSFATETKKVNITLPDPKVDLEAEGVANAMDAVVDAGTLLAGDGSPVLAGDSASIVTTTTQKLF